MSQSKFLLFLQIMKISKNRGVGTACGVTDIDSGDRDNTDV
jgi:hypothetical protein